MTVLALWSVAGLRFDASFEALLPDDAPQLATMAQVRERTGGLRQLVIALGGTDEAARLRVGRRIVEELGGLPSVRHVELEYPTEFFDERALWLMDESRLSALVAATREAVTLSKIRAGPFDLQLDEENEARELDEAWQRVDELVDEAGAGRHAHRYSMSADGRYHFLTVVPNVAATDIDAGAAVLGAIKERVARLRPAASGVEVRYAGVLEIYQENDATMKRDLRVASIIALTLTLLLLVAFTRRLIAPLLIGISLLAGVAWTFGVVRLLLGRVNIVTGFCVAILIGLGVDFCIHLFIRFRQEHEAGLDATQALTRTVGQTAAPALTGAITTAGVCFTFTLSDFRAFSETGFIAGLGVLLTLASSFMLLPPLLWLTSRRMKPPVPRVGSGARPVPPQVSWRVAAIVTAIFVAGAVYGGAVTHRLRYHNDLRVLSGSSEAADFFQYVDQNMAAGFNPAVVLAGSVEDARRIADSARARRDTGGSRIRRVLSVADLLPSSGARRERDIDELTRLVSDPILDRAVAEGGPDAAKLAEARARVRAKPWRVAELPEVVRRRLVTLDGSELIVYLWPDEQNNTDRQAVAWERELTELSGQLRTAGIEHRLADESLIFAWVDRQVRRDGPWLLGLAALVVFLVLWLEQRSLREALLLAAPLAVGLLTFAAALHGLELTLNMYNVVVIFVVVGVGIDDVVHIHHRYRRLGRGSALMAAKRAGTAALLTSLTTAAGFGATLVSHNAGLRSLGTLALVGITTTYLAAVLFFPALVTLLERHRRSS